MKSVLAWLFIPCVWAAFHIGMRIGGRVNQRPGAEELKFAVLNLEQHSSEMSPQLREYLKARAYTLLIGGIRSEWVDGRVDYGPVDSKVLGPIIAVKGPESNDDIYRLAMDVARKRNAEQAAPEQPLPAAQFR